MAVGFVAVGHRKPSGNVSGSAARDCRQSGGSALPAGWPEGRSGLGGKDAKGNRAEELQPRGAKRILGFPSRFSKACS